MNAVEQLREDFFRSSWFLSRPIKIQEFIRKYPPPCTFMDSETGVSYYVVGYSEAKDGEAWGFKVSRIDPMVDYDHALANTFSVCLNCISAGRIVECKHGK